MSSIRNADYELTGWRRCGRRPLGYCDFARTTADLIWAGDAGRSDLLHRDRGHETAERSGVFAFQSGGAGRRALCIREIGGCGRPKMIPSGPTVANTLWPVRSDMWHTAAPTSDSLVARTHSAPF